MKRRLLLFTLCVPLLGSLSACGGTLWPKPPAPPSRYGLDDGSADAGGPAPAAGAPVLLIAPPRAAPGFETAQMRYLGPSPALQTFAQSEWLAPPAELLAPLLVRALERSGVFRAVLLAPSSARADLRLETELIRLQQDFSQRPSQLQIGLRVLLIEQSSRRVLGARSFELRQPAASDDALGGVLAARLASAQLLGEISRFCVGLLA